MPSPVKAFFQSRLSDVESFFTNPNNHLAKFLKTSEGPDKVAKFADAAFDTVGEFAQLAGLSQRGIDGIDKGRAVVKTGRDVFALPNILRGIIPAFVSHSKNCYHLTKGLCQGNKVVRLKAENPDPKKRKHTDVTVGKKEMVLALGANFGKSVATSTYMLGFGGCRPIQTIYKYGRDKQGNPYIKMSEATLKFGNAFPIVMMINHVGGLLGGGFEIAYQDVAFGREVKHSRQARGDDEQARIDKAYGFYKHKVIEEFVGGLEKFLELLMDIVHVMGKAAPAWFRLPTTLGIGCCAIYKEWLKTA